MVSILSCLFEISHGIYSIPNSTGGILHVTANILVSNRAIPILIVFFQHLIRLIELISGSIMYEFKTIFILNSIFQILNYQN